MSDTAAVPAVVPATAAVIAGTEPALAAEDDNGKVLPAVGRLAQLETIINRWAPVVENLVQVELEAVAEGHTVGSIIREVGSRLLGILTR